MTTPAEYRQMADWCEYRAERVAGALREAAETQSKLAAATERLKRIIENERERLGPEPRLNQDDLKRYAWARASAALTAVLRAWEDNND